MENKLSKKLVKMAERVRGKIDDFSFGYIRAVEEIITFLADNVENKEQQAINYLRQLRGLTHSSEPQATNAVYIPPAQQLRNSADALEAKDRLLREIDNFLSEYGK